MTMIDFNNIKEGQKITFKRFGKTYTRKVQQVCTQLFNPEYVSFNVNKLGSGTGFTSVYPQDILSVK
jgi:hypothetical protein